MITRPRAMSAREAAAWAATAAASDRTHDGDQFIEEFQGDCSEDSPRDAAHAADDKHAQIPDRVHERKLVDACEPVIMDEQGAGHPRVEDNR